VSAAIVIDCPPGATGPRTKVCGLAVVERRVREAVATGAAVFVRADDATAERLDALPSDMPFGRLPIDAPLPSDAAIWPGDEILGVRVIDRASRRRAERALLATCRRPYDGPGDKYLVRNVSIHITRVLARTEISPTQVTLISALFGLLACGLVAQGDRASLAAGGAAFLFGCVLDSVDGEVARLRYKASWRGMVTDNVSDDVLDNLFVLALGIGVGGVGVWIGALAAGGRFLVALEIYREVARAGAPGDVIAFRWWYDGDGTTTERYGDHRSPLTLLRSIGRRDTYCLLYGALCLAGLGWPCLLLGAGIGASYIVLMAIHIAASSRADRRSPPRAPR
jgi:phosphatidylglycerophosphate synthase